VGFYEREQKQKGKNRPDISRSKNKALSSYSPFAGLAMIAEEQKLKEGERLYRTGEVHAAVQRFDQVDGLDKKDKYRSIASKCYHVYGKICLSEKSFSLALRAFAKSNSLQPSPDITERIQLIEAAVQAWEKLSSFFSITEFASRLGIITKDTNDYEPNRYLEYILNSKQISSILKIQKATMPVRRRTVEVHILGYYQARPPNKWATKIKEYKRACNQRMALPLGILMVDYLFWEKSLLSEIDIAVPVPPDPAKYAARRFGPTDQLAGIVQKYNAVPTRMAILRNDVGCFFSDVKMGESIAGKNILLIEDVVTTGYTVGRCCEILYDCSVSNVSILALGAASRNWFNR
jgi:hypothetical protein